MQTARTEAATRGRVEQEDLARRYRLLFEESPLLCATTRNVEGAPVVVECNRAFCDALGYPGPKSWAPLAVSLVAWYGSTAEAAATKPRGGRARW